MTSSLRMLALSSGGLLIATGVAIAQQLSVDINRISESGVGDKIGTILVKEGKGGVTFKVSAKGVPKGPHGFHVHDKGDCGAASKDGKMMAGLAAGPHYDPAGTKSHKGPKGDGHKGDLPVLNATKKGITQTVTAPQLKLADIRGRALMIHEGGDNYTDTPENGGGAGRIACGVVPK
jgi:superoxide dismutase, Cu-Zn family